MQNGSHPNPNVYAPEVEDMEKTESAMLQNPLKNMPEEVQQWVRTI